MTKSHTNSPSYVIQLQNGRLWRNQDADQASVFSSRENAISTIASTRMVALAGGQILRISDSTEAGAVHHVVDGYWTVAA